jgi:hypothetical protein
MEWNSTFIPVALSERPRHLVFGLEEQYQVLVTAPANKQFRVYMSRPRTRGKAPGILKVKRKAFPDKLFVS